MTDPSIPASGVTMFVLRGRPRLAEPRISSVTTHLEASLHDQLVQQAQVERTSVSSVVRDLVKLRFG